MPDKIYLIQDDKSLEALRQQPYPNEDDFQLLLEQYPDLAGRRPDDQGSAAAVLHGGERWWELVGGRADRRRGALGGR